MSASYPPLVELLDTMAGIADRGSQAVRAVGRDLTRVQGLLQDGELGKLPDALESLAKVGAELDDALADLRPGLPFDPVVYLASGAYLDELRTALEDAGLPCVEQDGRLLCSPSVVRVFPRESAVDIDGRRDRRLDPRTVAATIAEYRRQGPRYRPERFLNSVRRSYDLVAATIAGRPDPVVRLVDIWGVLTLLPSQDKQYSQHDFARDLYHLDASGITSTLASTRQLRWCASTGIRSSGVLEVVGTDGRPRRYWGVSFVEQHNGATAPQPERTD